MVAAYSSLSHIVPFKATCMAPCHHCGLFVCCDSTWYNTTEQLVSTWERCIGINIVIHVFNQCCQIIQLVHFLDAMLDLFSPQVTSDIHQYVVHKNKKRTRDLSAKNRIDRRSCPDRSDIAACGECRERTVCTRDNAMMYIVAEEKSLTIDTVTHSASMLFMGNNKAISTLSEVYSF